MTKNKIMDIIAVSFAALALVLLAISIFKKPARIEILHLYGSKSELDASNQN